MYFFGIQHYVLNYPYPSDLMYRYWIYIILAELIKSNNLSWNSSFSEVSESKGTERYQKLQFFKISIPLQTDV